MTGELSLGIDIGTSATKFVLLDPEVGVIAEESEPSGYTAPRPGFAEADPDGWWANIAAGTSRLLRKAQRTGGDVGAVGVSGMVPTIVLLDAEGRVLRPSIQQNDARAVSEIVWIRDRTEAADILRRTGSAVTQQSLAPKLRWLRDHEPDVMSAARHLCGSYDFAVHRLTGEWSAEHNWALESGLDDLTTGTWDELLLALAEIPKSWVAPVHRPADIVGVVSRAAAAVTGLADGTPVVAGSADHVASALAAGVARPGDLLVKLGSAGDVLFCSDEARVDRRLFPTTIDGRPLPAQRLHGVEREFPLQWFQRELGAGMPLRALDDEASGVRPGAEGLIVLPYFLGEKTTLFDPLARGTVVGLTLSHSRAHLFRAFLEGISFGFRHHIEVLAELGWLPTRVRCTNGGADSKLWSRSPLTCSGFRSNRWRATPGRRSARPSRPGWAPASSPIGSRAAGPCPHRDDVEPDQVAHGRYEALYPIFRDTYDRLKDVYPRLVARGGRGSGVTRGDGAGLARSGDPRPQDARDHVRLSGLVVAITGGGTGIGRACAVAYGREGAAVAVTDLDGTAAAAVAEEISSSGGRAEAWSLDVTDRLAVETGLAAIVTTFGQIDVWHNNAGVSTMNRFVDLTEDDWDVNMDVNAKSVFIGSQVVARYFIQRGSGGRIINTASMAGKRGNAQFLAPYVASKFAVVGLTQAMAAELAPHGIRVNSICPGYVSTAMQDREAAWEAELRGISPEAVRDLYIADTPLHRLEEADDVAAVAVFLAAPESAFVTGESINVNGGSFMD